LGYYADVESAFPSKVLAVLIVKLV
jgi:hypothetical protein